MGQASSSDAALPRCANHNSVAASVCKLLVGFGGTKNHKNDVALLQVRTSPHPLIIAQNTWEQISRAREAFNRGWG